jgi:meso-butanediol dehydrogenase/(S,S)-butanediol dehydrogenase/diacetyl reductase
MSSQSKRVAIVTGANGMRGIGRAIALRFAREGLDIALFDIKRSEAQIPERERACGWRGIEDVREEVQALGRRAICVYADITDQQQVEGACSRSVAELGAIDVLVNNARAAIGEDRVPVLDLDPMEWDRVVAVNMRGTFLLAQAVARHLVGRNAPGRIINMSSLSGKRGLANHAAYCATKFAVNGLTQVLALELGAHNITVNAICPGMVDTGRWSLSEQILAEQQGMSVEEAARRNLDDRAGGTALGRVATAEDVAGMAAFLISSDAGHITGQAMNVCGGETFH